MPKIYGPTTKGATDLLVPGVDVSAGRLLQLQVSGGGPVVQSVLYCTVLYCTVLYLSWRVCRRRIWDLDPSLELEPAWEIRSFWRRGTIDSLKLILLLLLFSLFSLKEVLLSSAARPSKLFALAAISDLLMKSGRSRGLLRGADPATSLGMSLLLLR